VSRLTEIGRVAMGVGRGADHGCREGKDWRGAGLGGGEAVGCGPRTRLAGSRVCRRCVGELEIGRWTV
jgi:hypothetical protein